MSDRTWLLESQNRQQRQLKEPTFYYFAYGSCMCPVDLKRTMGENTHDYVMGAGILKNYRLGFYRYSAFRKCGVLDVVEDAKSMVHGVLYQLPLRLSESLDKREDVPRGGYRQELVDIDFHGKVYKNVRTYVVVNKLLEEMAPNDWYFNVVLRGAITCKLPEEYCWGLFNHMHGLQSSQFSVNS
ncbi:MAG: gamma-glutamylcyclotransferase [Rivularia sp. (in: cyanobacteria)]